MRCATKTRRPKQNRPDSFSYFRAFVAYEIASSNQNPRGRGFGGCTGAPGGAGTGTGMPGTATPIGAVAGADEFGTAAGAFAPGRCGEAGGRCPTTCAASA